MFFNSESVAEVDARLEHERSAKPSWTPIAVFSSAKPRIIRQRSRRVMLTQKGWQVVYTLRANRPTDAA